MIENVAALGADSWDFVDSEVQLWVTLCCPQKLIGYGIEIRNIVLIATLDCVVCVESI